MNKNLLLAAAIVLVIAGCTYGARQSADGGIEYEFPDGSWRAAGDPCSCNDVQTVLYSEATGKNLLECLPNPEYACDGRTGLLPNGLPCSGTVACFGARCCVWVEGRP